MCLEVSWPSLDDKLNSRTVCADDFFFLARQHCRLQPLQNVDKFGERFAYLADHASSGADDVDPISFWHGLVEGNANRGDQTFSCTRRDSLARHLEEIRERKRKGKERNKQLA